MIDIDSEARTWVKALPAYIARRKVVLLEDTSCEKEVTSETAGRSSVAATRGKIDLADDEWAEITCV